MYVTAWGFNKQVRYANMFTHRDKNMVTLFIQGWNLTYRTSFELNYLCTLFCLRTVSIGCLETGHISCRCKLHVCAYHQQVTTNAYSLHYYELLAQQPDTAELAVLSNDVPPILGNRSEMSQVKRI